MNDEKEIAPAPDLQQKQKRKTHTSTAVISRYIAKTYQRFSFVLRNVEDAELIAAVEAARDPGESDSRLIKKILYQWQKQQRN